MLASSFLQVYLGSHNFHNFTAGKLSTDPSAMRYIKEIDCGQPFLVGNFEYVQIRIKGQSFMLHQIRKMIGLVIAIMRGHTTDAIIKRAWGPEKVRHPPFPHTEQKHRAIIVILRIVSLFYGTTQKAVKFRMEKRAFQFNLAFDLHNFQLDIPKAPALGLMLEQVHYDRYDDRFGGDGVHEAITWTEYQPEIHKFKHEYIYPNIWTTEENDERSVEQNGGDLNQFKTPKP